MLKNIVVIGGGGHGRSVIALLKKIKEFKILGYVDLQDRGELMGAPWLGDDTALARLYSQGQCSAAVIGIGSVRADRTRQGIFDRVKKFGFELPLVISPDAVVQEGVVLGEGTLVLDRAVVNCGVKLGAGVIINTGAIVDHDGDIGDFVHIAPGAVLSGNVEVGRFSLIGTGASVIQNCRIAEDCTIGAGAAVVKDCLKSGVYVGCPARLRAIGGL
jgi:sugar O-acyltransferase (sialic acid O-acetyltransferase NeuD family)